MGLIISGILLMLKGARHYYLKWSILKKMKQLYLKYSYNNGNNMKPNLLDMFLLTCGHEDKTQFSSVLHRVIL